ncbi:MAG: cache and HAMP domain-containing protein [Candidatus Thiodiazotropha sp.]
MAGESSVRFGIFFKMLLVMVLVATVPLGVVWYISHAASEQAIRQDVDNRLSSTADQLRSYVESWIDMNVRVLRQNAELPNIVSMDGSKQKKTLEAIIHNYEWAYLAFTIDINAQNVGRSDNKALKDYSDRHYVRQVLAGGDLGQEVLIGKTSGKPALVLAAPIKDSQKWTKGVLALAMNLSDISQKITSVHFGKTGHAILLDQDGKVISHFNKEYVDKRTSLANHPGYKALILANKESAIYTEDNGKKVIGQLRKTRHGWILLVEQDYDEAFAALKTYNRQTEVLMLVTVILVVLIAAFISRQLTRPIRQLTAAADAISHGNFDYEISDTKRSDELGELARSVERLGASVRLAMERFDRAV